MQQTYPIKQIQTYFAHKDEIALVILYGSFAQNKQNPHSDIDIAIARENSCIEITKMLEYNSQLSQLLDRTIDLVDLSKTEGIFLHQITTTGKVLKNLHSVNAYYVQKTLDFIADYYPIYKRDQDIRLKRMFNYKN